MDEQYYPRPDFKRECWYSLNGEWQFDFEENRINSLDEWMNDCTFSKKIIVPFTYQTKKSGIQENVFHDKVWYKKVFMIPKAMNGKRIFLKFGAVDYKARVWINGTYMGDHEGGYTPFQFEITEQIKEQNTVVVEAVDYPDTVQPRGKQYWEEEGSRCWYTPSTGIWQNVWLEAVEGSPIEAIKLIPDIDTDTVEAMVTISESQRQDILEFAISYQGKPVKRLSVSVDGYRTKVLIGIKPEDSIDEVHYWSPEHPNLYDMSIRLIREERVLDTVETYFGMRKVSIDCGKVLINNSPCYLKMILDQGYWEESGLTAPSDEALKQDILLTRKMGFNGARKHQKIEDPRYYYWADRLGLLVWGEVPSAYEYCDQEIDNITRDFKEFIKRDFNHPSIIAWVPLNESWGVRKILTDKRQQSFGLALYYLSKAMDPTRLVSTNDGWENVKTDIIGIHDYQGNGNMLAQKYTEENMKHPEGMFPGSRRLFAYGSGYDKSKNVFMMTEYGGIALASDTSNGENWGYDKPEKTVETLIKRYREVTTAIMEIPEISGFCYTQLTDVYQEVNGLLDMNHVPKVDADKIKEINELRK